MLKNVHVLLAVVTGLGFLMRSVWAFTAPDRLQQKWVRIAPHVIDTLLLLAGVVLVINLSMSFTDSWLVAKLVGLIAYIGFGVMTLRGSGTVRAVGFVCALLCLGYIFAVALTKQTWPLGT